MLFTDSYMSSDGIKQDLKNPNELLECYIFDEVSRLSQEKIQEFCAPGGVGEALINEGKFSRKSLVRLSKVDDIERRTTMAAFDIAKQKRDPLWAALAKNRIKERQLINNIMKKYGMQAKNVAKIGQREYLKHSMPQSFMRAGGETRL